MTKAMHTMYLDKRESGLSLVGGLAWGSHFCQIYRTKEEMLEVLLPFIEAGLENNEFCTWVLPRSVEPQEAEDALAAVPGFRRYRDKGQVEIVTSSQWLAAVGKAGGAVIPRLDLALLRGFDGLRLAVAALPGKSGGKDFLSRMDSIVRNNVIALFSYPGGGVDALSLMEMVKNHKLALVRNADRWEVIESSEARIYKDELRRSEEKLKFLFNSMSEGFAYHRIMLDSAGTPCDYVFLEVNDAFERVIGVEARNIIGKRATEVFPGFEELRELIAAFGKVALTGKPAQFEIHWPRFGKWLALSAFCPHKRYFAVTVNDISERKRTEEQLRLAHEELEGRVRERTEELATTVARLLAEIAQRKRAQESLQEETVQRLRAVEELRQKEQMLIQQSRQAALGEMIGNIAHQWRQPLNALGLLVQEPALLYEFATVEAPFLQQNAKKAMELIKHMSQTIDDFRNFFKPDKEKVPFRVHEEVAKTLTLMEGGVRGERLAIEVETRGEPVINGYPNEYSQVLLNILTNAMDALVGREIEDPRVKITIAEEGARSVVTIADNAGGITDEIIGKVFDPYFTTKGPQAGTGVGLFMSKTIIENNMGGLLTVRNIEGGAEFRIEV